MSCLFSSTARTICCCSRLAIATCSSSTMFPCTSPRPESLLFDFSWYAGKTSRRSGANSLPAELVVPGSAEFIARRRQFVGGHRKIALTSVCRSRGSGYGNLHMRRVFAGAVHLVGRLLIVGFLRFKNIRNEFLRVAVIEREPRALHLNHDAVAFFEHVIRRVQVNREWRNLPRNNRLGFLVRIAVAPAEDFVRDHQFETSQIPFRIGFVWIDVNQFHHPVGIRPRGRRKKL